jgi:hypothetical protein
VNKEDVVQVQKKSWAAAVSVAFLGACTQVPSSFNGESAPAPSAGTTASSGQTIGGVPVTINCGVGKQALVRQVSFDGRAASQVDCVDSRRLFTSADVSTIEDEIVVPQPEPAPVRRTVYTPPARERVVERVVYRDAPSAPAPKARRKRPGAQSALIIAGSTAAGAGAGAVIGGKKGAIIGGVLGGVGGTIYDRTTRNPK